MPELDFSSGNYQGPVGRRQQVLMNTTSPGVSGGQVASPAAAPSAPVAPPTGGLPSGLEGAGPGALTPGSTPGAGQYHSMYSPSPIASHLSVMADAVGRRLQQLLGGG